MQKVSELKYERLSMEEFAQEIKEVIHQVKTADSARAVLAARDRCNQADDPVGDRPGAVLYAV